MKSHKKAKNLYVVLHKTTGALLLKKDVLYTFTARRDSGFFELYRINNVLDVLRLC